MSSMAFSLSIWIGSFIVISQVDVVGRQHQPWRQLWTNSTMNFLGNPRGGIWEDPVIHLTRSIKLTSSMPVMEKGDCSAMQAQNKKLDVSWNGMMGLRWKGKVVFDPFLLPPLAQFFFNYLTFVYLISFHPHTWKTRVPNLFTREVTKTRYVMHFNSKSIQTMVPSAFHIMYMRFRPI